MDRGNPFPIGHTWILRDWFCCDDFELNFESGIHQSLNTSYAHLISRDAPPVTMASNWFNPGIPSPTPLKTNMDTQNSIKIAISEKRYIFRTIILGIYVSFRGVHD